MKTVITALFLFGFVYAIIEGSPTSDVGSNQSEESQRMACASTHGRCIAGNDCSCCGQYDKCDCTWNRGVRTCKCKRVAILSDWKENLNCAQ
uniref:U34-Theriditoxin-Lha1a_1 n=1 Tax=Latrodectus hasselti TaxID=256736 RepID=A0A482ZIV8_LATHA